MPDVLWMPFYLILEQRCEVLVSLLLKQGSQGSDRLRKLPTIAQPGSGRTGIWIQICLTAMSRLTPLTRIRIQDGKRDLQKHWRTAFQSQPFHSFPPKSSYTMLPKLPVASRQLSVTEKLPSSQEYRQGTVTWARNKVVGFTETLWSICNSRWH